MMCINAKATPTNDTNYSCYIKAVKLNLTNDMRSTSHYYLLLATQTHTDIGTESFFKKPVVYRSSA